MVEKRYIANCGYNFDRLQFTVVNDLANDLKKFT